MFYLLLKIELLRCGSVDL